MNKQPDNALAGLPARRLLAVGDIHGCHELLAQLLREVGPGADDRLVFLGDYVDRGPDSRGVIDTLLVLVERWPQTIFLRGNHEQMFLDFIDGRASWIFLANGGQQTLDSYGAATRNEIPASHQAFLRQLPTSYRCGEFLFVHAGLRPGVAPEDQREEDLLWIRAEFLDSDYDWGQTIVFGHTPQPRPLLAARRIGLDTGAVYGRQLTCCDLLSRRCWQVG
ncbi:metallophosphoesterase family protein [Desulfuromonas carbonis]|uniref:metallophosphoesterase family protein n=1 Tax=Desulfuromonas sp. DDH964 TaxID=1823759 RepID=UPI00078EE5DA|nr:metallophosphoesterase family protein [Desulfuromonas sp. DDH964]AMV73501.1 metallophosphoesterase [Desulfuromonas sp. DDH964]